MTLTEIKAYLEQFFQDIEILGEVSVQIERVGKIEGAKKGDLTFVSNPKYEKFVSATQASVVLVPKKLELNFELNDRAFIKVDDPYIAFVFLLEKMSPPREMIPLGVHSTAVISESVVMGENVSIGANVYIGNNCEVGDGTVIGPGTVILDGVKVGKNCKLYPNVTIYDGCRLGDRIIIHSGTSIGADGFGFAPKPDGSYRKIPQIGIVVIEDEVELGANLCIDRATLGETVVRRGAKIDNLVQVAHNCVIGSNTVIASQAGVSGSTKIGNNCMVAGQVGFVGHIEIADGVNVGAKAGVSKSFLEKGQTIRGAPAQAIREQMKQEALLRKLPEMMQRIQALEAELKALKS
ncbi:UDP-3-O-(3-hydroxymyristoyl) glucosamine N-acyltransferase [Chloroherpeton thalassium ATCC 35110]|uniref:UDP-3-O-acylglucosamine N-acyltransferase n=1 Tax=Chloroherpeton thalassium (strain ATCC 35110 / GB-78) TaxID=517418 RepID=B3QWH4_CHLT3|nr:UDP-3-O-(3-hydroxymyristoyl)glucosamine N-acyltransferase [Chloroherpeton thalassium]ACF14734.1 UDP-3-O-(3-hydroxymyristoyl) glucosamine N-acyltransferase [Chloroherpeton thalassium ATCC 35110]